MNEETKTELRTKIEEFLNLNYPCNCTNEEDKIFCPQNSFEADEIVKIITDTI